MPEQRKDWDGLWARRMATLRRGRARSRTGKVAAGEFNQERFFSSDVEKVIQNGVTRLFYERRLPNGGDKELALAAKMTRMANVTPGGAPMRGLKGIPGLGIATLAGQYRETKGWYYVLKPLSDGAMLRWQKIQSAEWKKSDLDANHDLVWFCELRLKGIPTQVANFRMTCLFTLVRADGKRDRVVEVVTEKGERSGRIRLDAESFSTPSGRTGFRTWLMNHGNGVWIAGERELQALQADMSHDAAFMDVHEVSAVGYDAASGLWFFADCAFGGKDAGAALLLPDEDGVYWHEGTGYQLALSGSGNQPFAQGLPVMHPMEGLVFKPREGPPAEDEVLFALVKGAADDPAALDRLFADLAFRMKEALGSYEAYLVLGAFLSFAGRPEFFRREKCFPGLILHGETGQGKTSLCQWMMELPGFHQMSEGVGLSRNSTVVGMQILLEQYSCLPGWLSDFSNTEVTGEKQQIMHGAYNGAMSVKYTMDGTTRKSRTMFVVDGESRPAKTSTRYRYVQVLVSKMNRKGNQVPWFESHRRFFLLVPFFAAPAGAVCGVDDGEFCGYVGHVFGHRAAGGAGAWGGGGGVFGGGDDVWQFDRVGGHGGVRVVSALEV